MTDITELLDKLKNARATVELVDACCVRVCTDARHFGCPFGDESMADCSERLQAAYEDTVENLLQLAEAFAEGHSAKDQDLVNALRCVSTPGGPVGDCKKCAFYTVEHLDADLAEKAGADEWVSCDVDGVGRTAADRIANQNTHILALQKEIERLRSQMPQWIPVTEPPEVER